MKCLSLRQPYAELLVSGKKTIELRTWNTKFRAEFLVHASKKIDKKACERNKIDTGSVTTGAIIGKATLCDIKFYANTKALTKDKDKHLAGTKILAPRYGFLVKNAIRLNQPKYIGGKLGFFDVNP